MPENNSTQDMSAPISVEDDRTGMHPVVLRRAFTDHVQFSRSRDLDGATPFDRYMALAYSVRDRLVQRWAKTQRTYYERDVKRAYYLSAEFLLGRALVSNLQALGIYDDYREVLGEMGIDLDELVEREPDAGLGNGGLGRLAACLLESLATLGYPGSGYGIRYEFGIFEQVIRNGHQVERADEWLRFGNPWEIARPEYTVPVQFGGHTEQISDGHGGFRVIWSGADKVLGVPYDTPIAGYRSTPSTRSDSGRPGRPKSSISASSTTAITCGRCRPRTTPRSFPRFCIPTTTSRPAASSAFDKNTSSSPARCTTSSRASSGPMSRLPASPRRWPSSSMIPIRPSPSPSSCGSSSICTACSGMKRGGRR